MSEHLFEVGIQVVSSAAAGALCEIIPAALATGKRMPEIREIGVTNVTGVAGEIGFGQPAAIGVTPATEKTVQAINTTDTIAGNTVVAASWATAPTAPTTYRRRSEVGVGFIWVWNPGEFVMWSGATISTLILYQISTLAVTYDLYFKVAE